MKRKGRRPMSAAAKAAHKEWTLEVQARAFHCEGHRFFVHTCDGTVDSAHIIPKRFLKDATLGWSEVEALAVIYDLRNGLCLCRAAHNVWDGPYCPVVWEQLPAEVVSFATEHGMLWKLEKMYPPKAQAA